MEGLPAALRRSFEAIQSPIGFPTAEEDAVARERLGLSQELREPNPERPNLFGTAGPRP